jgi:hypothetical protein
MRRQLAPALVLALAAALALLHDLYKERPAAPGRYLVATLKGFAPLGDPKALPRIGGSWRAPAVTVAKWVVHAWGIALERRHP